MPSRRPLLSHTGLSAGVAGDFYKPPPVGLCQSSHSQLYSFSPQVTRKHPIIVEVFTKKSWDFSDRNCCRPAIFMVRDSGVSVEATDLA